MEEVFSALLQHDELVDRGECLGSELCDREVDVAE